MNFAERDGVFDNITQLIQDRTPGVVLLNETSRPVKYPLKMTFLKLTRVKIHIKRSND